MGGEREENKGMTMEERRKALFFKRGKVDGGKNI